jgi:hypothetical protein
MDSTSHLEVEEDGIKKSNPPVKLTPRTWLLELFLGAGDLNYDT